MCTTTIAEEPGLTAVIAEDDALTTEIAAEAGLTATIVEEEC